MNSPDYKNTRQVSFGLEAIMCHSLHQGEREGLGKGLASVCLSSSRHDSRNPVSPLWEHTGSTLELFACSCSLATSFILLSQVYLNQSGLTQAFASQGLSLEFFKTSTSWVLLPPQSPGPKLCGPLLHAPREPAFPCKQSLL